MTIYRVNADGSGLTQLTNDQTAIDWIPDWQPLPAAGNTDVVVNDDTSQTFLNGLTTILGDLRIIGTTLTSIALPGLTSVNGTVDINGNEASTTIDLGGMQTVSGSLFINNNTAASTIDLGGLATAGGNIDVTGNTAATTIDLDSLEVAGGT